MKRLQFLQQKLDEWLTLLASFFKLISGISLVIIVVTFAWLVYGRYVLNSTPTWVEQLALLLVVVITFFSSAVGLKEKTHLSVDILPYMLPLRARLVLFAIINVILIWFGYIMMTESYNLAVFNWSTVIPLLDVPLGLRSIPLVISGGLICLFCFNDLLKNIIAIATGDFSKESEDNISLVMKKSPRDNQ